jgi:hypothetical protein
MTKARLDGLYLLLLGALVFLLAAVVLIASTSAKAPVDFRGVYYPARCLIQHWRPLQCASEVQRIYRSEGGSLPSDAPVIEEAVTQLCLPAHRICSSQSLSRCYPGRSAHFVWMVLTAGWPRSCGVSHVESRRGLCAESFPARWLASCLPTARCSLLRLMRRESR